MEADQKKIIKTVQIHGK